MTIFISACFLKGFHLCYRITLDLFPQKAVASALATRGMI